MKVVYDCSIPEVMGYPERNYSFTRGDDQLLIWDGYLSELLRSMWSLYGCVFDPDNPHVRNLDQLPFLRAWNEGNLNSDVPFPLTDPATAARAFRDSVALLRERGATLADSIPHGEALVRFLEEAHGQTIQLVEAWL